MGTNDIPVENLNEVEVPQKSNRTPVRSFTTAWLRSDLGFFYVHVAIVGPVPEEPQGCFPLSLSKANDILKTFTNIIELLEEQSR